ncbi:hypothetical protein AAE026_34465 [Bradyrhizobium sp. DN5]
MSPELQIELKNAAATPRFFVVSHTRGRRYYRRLRHCERSEAIQTVTAEGFWIASPQGLLAMTALRAALAMMILMQLRSQ